MKECILIFEVNDSIMKQRLRQALMPLKMRIKYVSSSEYEKTIGEIAGLPADPTTARVADKAPAPADGMSASNKEQASTDQNPASSTARITAPMLIFVGLTEARLDAVLINMRKRSVNIPYKAILTPYNQAWKPAALFDELRKEHALMNKPQGK